MASPVKVETCSWTSDMMSRTWSSALTASASAVSTEPRVSCAAEMVEPAPPRLFWMRLRLPRAAAMVCAVSSKASAAPSCASVRLFSRSPPAELSSVVTASATISLNTEFTVVSSVVAPWSVIFGETALSFSLTR